MKSKLRFQIYRISRTGKFLILLKLMFLLTLAAKSQSLTGIVLDENGKPLGGTMITSVKTITHTKPDGTFQISAAYGDILKFTYVGFQPFVQIVRSQQHLNIYLKPLVNEVEAVAITYSTGYLQVPKERATGSFTQLDKKTLNEQVGANIMDRLEAAANSFSIDRSTSQQGRMMVRGLSTINGPKSLLVVLDNFPYEGDIANINPNDIESVTILKDAAAASIWGTRAGNGVVVITTKEARYTEKLSVELNTNFSTVEKPDLSYIRQMSSTDFIDVEQLLFDKGFFTSQINSSSKPVLSPAVELFIKKQQGTISADELTRQLDLLKSTDLRNDFNRYFYRKGQSQQYALNLKGGADNFAWNLSSGYDATISNLDADYNRLTLRFQNTLRPIKHLELSAGAMVIDSKLQSGKPGYGDISAKGGLYIYPYADFADDEGNALPLFKDLRQTYVETAGNGKLLDWTYYPMEDYKNAVNTTKLRDLNLNAGLNYRLLKSLNIDLKYLYERQQSSMDLLQNENSYYTRNLINTYTQINATTGALTYKVPLGGILDLSEKNLINQNFRGQLNFNRSWKTHEIVAIAGTEIRETKTTGNSFRTYGYKDNILASTPVDYTTAFPSIVNGFTGFLPNTADLSAANTRFLSFYGNGAYTYGNRYTLSASIRRDASNMFGLHTNDKWNPLWSAGLGWNLSREDFYQLPFLPHLKLRATYGFSGNVNPAMTAVTTIEYVNASSLTGQPYTRFNNYYNPELKWETVNTTNFGLDFATKGNRISGSLEYYRKSADNLFGTALVDYTGGVGVSILKNVAKMQARGWDLELNSQNIKGKFSWSTNFNFSTYSDEVLNYYLASKQGSIFINTKTAISGVEGKPVYSIFSYKWAGLDGQTGDPQGYLNGEVSKNYAALTGAATTVNDLNYHGSAIPKVYGSMGNNLSYKNFALSARLGFKLKYFFRRESIAYNTLFNNWRGDPDYALRWQKPGDETLTYVPSLSYPASTARDNFYRGSEVLIEKGDHIRLHYINASYSLNQTNYRHLPVKSAQVYLNASNLGILWRANKQKLDPDYYFGYNSLPPSKTIAIGVKANF